MARAAKLLEETIGALSLLDGDRLQRLEESAVDMSAEPVAISGRESVQVRALQNTLLELLRTTDENLRLLRALSSMRVDGLGPGEAAGGAPWVR